MRTLLLQIFGFSMALIAPLVPVAVHAATLTGDVGLTVSTGATTSVSEDTNVQVDTQPLVVTRADLSDDTSTDTSSGLRAHVNALASNDANVSSVALSNQNVSLLYREPAKLFGVVTINVPVKVSVAASGKANVSYPWYSFLLATDKDGLAVRAQVVANQELGANTASSTLSTEDQVRVLDSLHAVMQSELDAETATDTSE